MYWRSQILDEGITVVDQCWDVSLRPVFQWSKNAGGINNSKLVLMLQKILNIWPRIFKPQIS